MVIKPIQPSNFKVATRQFPIIGVSSSVEPACISHKSIDIKIQQDVTVEMSSYSKFQSTLPSESI